eukprot:Clim_evm57s88 gene=Clim_evmTU57s88
MPSKKSANGAGKRAKQVGVAWLHDFVVAHLLHTVICATTLLYFVDTLGGLGHCYFFLSAFYCTWVIALAVVRGYDEWLSAFTYVLPLSIFQVWPDWFLASHIGTLEFAVKDFYMIGPVPAFMALMWTTPIFVSVMQGVAAEKMGYNGALVSALTATTIFGISEQVMSMCWYQVNVRVTFTIFEGMHPVALYVIPAELLLGLVAFQVHKYYISQYRPWNGLPQKVLAALMTSVMYLGCMAFFWSLIEDGFPSKDIRWIDV